MLACWEWHRSGITQPVTFGNGLFSLSRMPLRSLQGVSTVLSFLLLRPSHDTGCTILYLAAHLGHLFPLSIVDKHTTCLFVSYLLSLPLWKVCPMKAGTCASCIHLFISRAGARAQLIIRAHLTFVQSMWHEFHSRGDLELGRISQSPKFVEPVGGRAGLAPALLVQSLTLNPLSRPSSFFPSGQAWAKRFWFCVSLGLKDRGFQMEFYWQPTKPKGKYTRETWGFTKCWAYKIERFSFPFHPPSIFKGV